MKPTAVSAPHRRACAWHAAAFALLLPLAAPAWAGGGRAAARGAGAGDVVQEDGEVPLEARVEAARTALIERLNGLAGWCSDKQLFLERDRVWRRVLELSPDDATARKGLRYARNVDGTWKEPAPREVKNMNKKALEELPAREEAAYAPFGDELLALAIAPERTTAEREHLLADLCALAPDHAGYHQWLGDVKVGDRWVLPETAQAKDRRAEIRAVAQSAPGAVAGIQAATAAPEEAALGVTWTVVLQGENVRVLSTGSAEEAERLLRACEATAPLLATALGGEFRFPGAYTVYVLTQRGEKEAFLQKLPGVSDADRARMLGLEGTGIPGTLNVALFGKEAPNRLDAAVRHTLGNVLSVTLALDSRTGWAFEGLGLYLTREIVGTRLTWFVSESADPAAATLRGRLTDPATNWIQEAWVALASPNSAPLGDVLTRDLDRIDVPAALTSYAFVAYLLEGRPREVFEVVRRCAGREDPAVVTKELLGYAPEELQARVLRWLSERR